MNFKQQARQLEKFLEEELSKKIPIVQLNTGSLIYKNFIVKKNKQDKWIIKKIKGQTLDIFNLKTCALTAAKLYSVNSFKRYNEIKILDELYHKNNTDAFIYKFKYENSKNEELRDMFISRYIEAKSKASYAKEQIVDNFNLMF